MALALVWLLVASVARAQPPTLEQAAARLEEAATRLEAGDTEGARALLAGLEEVTLPEAGLSPSGDVLPLPPPGTTVRLAPEGWEPLLAAPPEEAARLLHDAAAALRDAPTTLPSDARARLDRVLAQASFQPSWWERLLAWLTRWLPETAGAGSLVRTLVRVGLGALGALLVGGVVWMMVRGLRRNTLRDKQAPLPFGAVPRGAGEAQARASEVALAGDFREAMRLLYLAALLHLDEVGLIRFDRALTNREVLASTAGHAPLRALLAPVVAQFDRVWYGHAPFGEAEFEQVRGQIEQLRTLERAS